MKQAAEASSELLNHNNKNETRSSPLKAKMYFKTLETGMGYQEVKRA